MAGSRNLRQRLSADPDSRMLLQAQFPLDAAVLLLAIFIVFTNPPLAVGGELLTTYALLVAGTLATIFVPWRRISHRWLVLVALVDVIAVAIMRDATTGALVGVGILVVFPVIFLAYSFSLRVLIVAILGALFVVGYPFIRAQAVPSNATEWGSIVVVPITVCFIAIAVHLAAQRFRAQRAGLREASSELTTSRLTADDRQFTINAIANGVDAAILVYDNEGRIVLLNRPGRDVILKAGVTPEAHENERVMLFEEDGTPLDMHRHDFNSLTRGAGLQDRLLVIGAPGTEQTALSITSRGILRPSGERVGTVVVGHDVTSFVEAAHDRDIFLQTMSHELRTPLTSILGYLEVVEDSIDAEEVGIAGELDVIRRNANRLNALTSALLNVASGPRPFVAARVNLDRIVAQALDDSRETAQRARVALRGATADGVVATLDVDLFREVLDNLISNAIKYTPPDGSVDVSLATQASEVVLTVRDTGSGIADDEKAHVFDQFYRGRVARQQAVQGVGVGLTLVRDAVAAHGGTVDIASATGSGTTVTVRIPLAPAA